MLKTLVIDVIEYPFFIERLLELLTEPICGGSVVAVRMVGSCGGGGFVVVVIVDIGVVAS